METINIIQFVLAVLQLIALSAFFYFSRKATKIREQQEILEQKQREALKRKREQQEVFEREMLALRVATLARSLRIPKNDL